MKPDPLSRRHFIAAGVGAAAGMGLTRGTLLASGAAPSDRASSSASGSASDDPARLSLRSAADRIHRGALSPVTLTQACLARIERLNPSLNAFITVTADRALVTAREREAEQKAGRWRGPLHGIPIALKDNIDTAGVRTTGASALFADRIPGESAEVVRRLEEAGAVLIGKTNLQEFAYGGTCTVSAFGPVHNPWAPDRIAGGSSGGSAVAVAADLCLAAVGTDTAGSIRIPAAFCGVVGLKPTYGRVSNRGVIPLSWTIDHVGPLTKTVEDAALVLQAIAGYDPAEPTTPDRPVEDYARALDAKASRPRLGLPRSPLFEELDSDVAGAVAAALEKIRPLAAEVVDDVVLPPAGLRSSGLYPRVRGPEAYAYHARWLQESPGKYQDATRAALLKFADTKADDYARARRELDLLRRDILATFARVDLLVMPTMLAPPILIAEADRENPVDWRNTSPFSTAGLPAISIPCGRTSNGLPIGLQIAAAPFDEARLLSFAAACERVLGWRGLGLA
ncbi:MAG TPA: amidase [Candidatus Polarisedimenticolia bacterium]|nr:amidase [Candidatus Polarisedimenticolia bacterium]